MDVKEAVKRAKQYVAELYEEEGLVNLGLEEIEFDEKAGLWRVTLGFSRPWNTLRNALTRSGRRYSKACVPGCLSQSERRGAFS